MLALPGILNKRCVPSALIFAIDLGRSSQINKFWWKRLVWHITEFESRTWANPPHFRSGSWMPIASMNRRSLIARQCCFPLCFWRVNTNRFHLWSHVSLYCEWMTRLLNCKRSFCSALNVCFCFGDLSVCEVGNVLIWYCQRLLCPSHSRSVS